MTFLALIDKYDLLRFYRKYNLSFVTENRLHLIIAIFTILPIFEKHSVLSFYPLL